MNKVVKKKVFQLRGAKMLFRREPKKRRFDKKKWKALKKQDPSRAAQRKALKNGIESYCYVMRRYFNKRFRGFQYEQLKEDFKRIDAVYQLIAA